MKDVDVAIAGVKSVEGRKCGNGLVVSHRGEVVLSRKKGWFRPLRLSVVRVVELR